MSSLLKTIQWFPTELQVKSKRLHSMPKVFCVQVLAVPQPASSPWCLPDPHSSPVLQLWGPIYPQIKHAPLLYIYICSFLCLECSFLFYSNYWTQLRLPVPERPLRLSYVFPLLSPLAPCVCLTVPITAVCLLD